jgi:hypothetical protein
MMVLVGLVAIDRGGGFRLPWMVSGGGVDFGRPTPLIAPEPFPPEEVRPPPDLIVTDTNGSALLTPLSYCWSSGNAHVCAESSAAVPGTEPAFVAVPGQPVMLDFQATWDLALRIEPEDPSCPTFSVELPDTGGTELDMLGGPGGSVVFIFATTDRGDASWVIRVDNRVDTAGC